MQEPRERSENPFDGLQTDAQEFFNQCCKQDKNSPFVGDLNSLLVEGITTAALAKNLDELLRGRRWLRFISELRSSNYNAAEALLLRKNNLVSKGESIAKRLAATASTRDTHKSGTPMGRPDDKQRYSY